MSNQYWKNQSTRRKYLGDSSDDDESFIEVPDEPKTKSISTQTDEPETKTISTQTETDEDEDVDDINERFNLEYHCINGSIGDHSFHLLDVVLTDLELVNDLKESLEKERIIRKLIIHKMGLIKKMHKADKTLNGESIEMIEIMIQIEELEERLLKTIKNKIYNFEKLRNYIFT